MSSHRFATQDSWLEGRRDFVGASEVAGLWVEDLQPKSPWATPMKIYSSKVIGFDEKPDSPKMKAGRMLERTIFEWWAREVRAPGVYRWNVDEETEEGGEIVSKGRLGSTVDGWRIRMGRRQPCEVKNLATTRGFVMAKGGQIQRIPYHYWIQCQSHMHCEDADVCHFIVLFSGWNLRWITIERDRKIGQVLQGLADSFWRQHVEPKIQPPLTLGDDPSSLPPDSPRHEKLIQSPQAVIIDVEAAALSKAISWLTRRRKMLVNTLAQMAGGQKVVLGNGSSWRFSDSGGSRKGEDPQIDIDAATKKWWEAGLRNEW